MIWLIYIPLTSVYTRSAFIMAYTWNHRPFDAILQRICLWQGRQSFVSPSSNQKPAFTIIGSPPGISWSEPEGVRHEEIRQLLLVPVSAGFWPHSTEWSGFGDELGRLEPRKPMSLNVAEQKDLGCLKDGKGGCSYCRYSRRGNWEGGLDWRGRGRVLSLVYRLVRALWHSGVVARMMLFTRLVDVVYRWAFSELKSM